MADKPGETPEGTTDSGQEAQGQKNREIVKQIIQKAEQVVRVDKDRGPLAIMEKISEIIDDPSKNDIARKLSLLLAKKAPKTLLKNRHMIKGQHWTNEVLRIAMANMGDEPE